ncbi:HNH endonuclease [Halorarius halobius]|uniref:HNH endonuclease n=1 Tax=Halorarius halobius TaxID=2962671 RepID=UPI0033137D2A
MHHAQVHGEPLPNRECGACETEFYSEYEQKYCSNACREEAVSFAGENNPNYSGGKETTACETCDAEFEYYPSEKPGRFCPDCVEMDGWRDPPSLTSDDNPQYEGGKVELTCEVCDAAFERYPSNVTGEVSLCSEDCRAEWLSEAFTGEGHPNWEGGTTGPYGQGWNEVRERALERDDRTCLLCGADADDLDRNPDVHHIVPVRAFVESPVLTEADAHTLDNVVTLCPACHRRAEFGGASRAELRHRAGIA